MVKKTGKKRIILSLLLALYACCVGGVLLSVSADDEPTVTFSEHNILQEYVTNAIFTTPKVTAQCDGVEYETDCTIVFPDGTTTYSDVFILDQSGTYSITYSAVIEGKTYSTTKKFITKDTSSNLFTLNKASMSFGKASFFEDVYGAEVTAKAGSTVEYNKVINLSQSTKFDELIEILATPNKSQTEDFSEIYVNLTDIYDESNFVSIKVYSAKDNSRYSSYVQAKAPGQRYCGLENGRPNFGISAGGLVIRHSFGGYYPLSEGGNAIKTIKLYYDNAERAVYADVLGTTRLALDLNDLSYIDAPWKGFTTGEVKLSITIGDVAGSPKYVIKSIDGNHLTAEYPVDVKSPVLVCDVPADIPMAVISKKYAVFGAQAYDNYLLSSFTSKVYYRYNTGNEVDVSVIDGCFVPNKEGVYTIVYTATDLAGNVSKREVPITAVTADDITPLQITLASVDAETKQVGEKIYLRSYETDGGVGYDNVTVQLKKGDETLQTISGNSFNVYEEGTYKVVYTATDYVGNIATASNDLTIVANTAPLLLDEIVIPEAFVSGLPYTLPKVNAYDYTSGNEVLVEPIITAKLNGADVAVNNGVVIPVANETGDEITISYTYTNAGGSSTTWQKSSPVVIVKQQSGAINQSSYFYTEGFMVASVSDCISFYTSAPSATATFIRPVQAKNLTLNLAYSNDQFEGEWFDVIIADKHDAMQKVTLRIYNDSTISINGGNKMNITSNRDEDKTNLTIYYKNQTRAFSDSIGNGLGTATTTVTGEDFNGFTSEEVLITIQSSSAGGDNMLYCSMINNQPTTQSSRDNIAPQLYLNETLGGKTQKGATVQIYRAQAYDVLNDVVSLTVTCRNLDTDEVISDVNGTPLLDVSADKDYSVRLDEYGRYQVEYVAKDTAGKSVTATKVINVFDDQPPTIKISGKMPTTAKFNSTVKVPKYTVSDAQTDEIVSYTLAIAPNGEMIYFESEFVPHKKGNWTICYFAMDANGQISTVEYQIDVQ